MIIKQVAVTVKIETQFKTVGTRIFLLLAFTILGIAVIAGCQGYNKPWHLLVRDPDNTAVFFTWEVEPGSAFMLSYRHSVSNSMVLGTFLITDQGLIQPLTTSYSTFGPGLPLDYVEKYTIDDGIVTVYHQEKPREYLKLWVSPQTEESILIEDQSYPLFKLTESHLLVEISVEK
jgi:hypothetical protein